MARASDGMTPPAGEKSDQSSYELMRRILRRKKTWEASALRAAKSREESLKIDDNNAAVDADDDAREREELSDKAAREDAMMRANEARDELNRIFLRQAELEKSTRQWNERMNDYEQSSLRGEKDELEKLQRDHDDEIERLEEKMRVENEIDEEERKSAAIGRKRMAKEGAAEEEESRRKRQKVGESITAKAGGNASDSEINNTPTGWMANSNAGDGSGKIGVGEEKVSGSVQKEEELKKILDEMSYLNKTKSQMIWLLKQVITAETKMKR